MPARAFELGKSVVLRGDGAGSGAGTTVPFQLAPHHLVTHGVVVGMTGSGKTGLAIGLLEEAIRSKIPVLMFDLKGDLPNLGLLFDHLSGGEFAPWIDPDAARRDGKTPEAVATGLAEKWKAGLATWGLAETDVASLRAAMKLRVITPGTTSAGEPLNVLSPLETKGDLWNTDEEAAREALSGALSLLLRMIQRDADPTRSKEHVLLAHLAEMRQREGKETSLEALIGELQNPRATKIGALGINEFYPAKDRATLAQDLNALLASPTFRSWRQGAPLDVKSWMTYSDDRTPATILSVAHLEDEERMLVLGMVLEQVLAWVRGLSGTTDLRALVFFDEVFGYLPPHPNNPPTKRPLLGLLKQARAFGVGCVVATQNPIDLDYKALSNAGVWFVGRLQTDADRERLVEGLSGADAQGGESLPRAVLESAIKSLPPRTFLVRNVHARGEPAKLLETRWTMSWLRGPMTRVELKKLVNERLPDSAAVIASANSTNASTASPTLTTSAGPSLLPDGWRSFYPHPPAAPVNAWMYVPHIAMLVSAELSDKKSGTRISRKMFVVAPMTDEGASYDEVRSMAPDVLDSEAVAGARFETLAEKHRTPKQVKSYERGLKERAMDCLSLELFASPDGKNLSQPGESREAFVARVQSFAVKDLAEAEAALVAKYEARIQKLSLAVTQADKGVTDLDAGSNVAGAAIAILTGRYGTAMRQGAQAMRKRERSQEKTAKAKLALDEVVQKRNAEIHALRSEIAEIAVHPVVLRPKTGDLRIEAYGIAWLAR